MGRIGAGQAPNLLLLRYTQKWKVTNVTALHSILLPSIVVEKRPPLSPLTYVRKIGKPEFTLAEVYAYEEAMHAVYPENSHVREKIWQQLQELRDLGYLEFPERGRYRVVIGAGDRG